MDNENEENAVDNLTTDLAAAWDEAESTDETPVEEEHLAEDRGETGGDLPAEGDELPSEDVAAAADDKTAGSGDNETGELNSAPKSLSATAREAWDATPAPMRAEIAKREKDFQQGIQKYAENAQRAQAMDQSLQPYQQYIQMSGGPQKAIEGLLQTGSALQMGSPIQKAQMVSNLIQQFGIDIPTLDGILSGNGAPESVQQQSEVQQQVAAALQPYQQHMAQLQQQQRYEQEQAQSQVTNEISAFSQAPENEFYNDVKMRMADILDLAANRGQEMGLEEAYNTACLLTPEIKKIMDSRAFAANTETSRRAASSIHGTPGGPGGAATHDDMRSAIESAWDNAGRV